MTRFKALEKNSAASQGFTLVEMAFLVLILGLFIGSTISFMSTEDDTQKLKVTQTRQQKVAIALSNYANRRGILPCPGDPTASPLGYPRSGCASADYRTLDGVVPYKELGLTQTDVIDGYGNPFTYAVAPAAHSIVNATAPTGTAVHDNCVRNSKWNDGAGSRNYNPVKARFCCPKVPDASNMVVKDASGNPVTTTQGASGATGTFYNLYDNPTATSSAASTTLTYMAYALISHGKNGYGAYIWSNSSRRTSTNASTAELENINSGAADNVYIAKPIDMTSTSYFDDVVLWRTQEGTVSETGQTTCQFP